METLTQRISTFISTVLTPLLMPTYGVFLALWVSLLCYLPTGVRLAVLAVVFGLTFVLPVGFIALLYRLKMVNSYGLNGQQERKIPYAFAIVCYVIAAFYLRSVHAPMWLSAFVWGGIAATAVAFTVNFWWKISGHLTGCGGLTALLFYIHTDGLGAFELFWVVIATIVISGFVGTARLALHRHTLAQVIAGFVNGFLCVSVALQIAARWLY